MSARQLRASTIAQRLKSSPDKQTDAGSPANGSGTQPLTRKRKLSIQAEPTEPVPDGQARAGIDKKCELRPMQEKPSPVRYLCTVCDRELPSKLLPNGNPTESCKHLINTCTKCLQTWVKTQINDGNFKSVGDDTRNLAIRCPECPELMLNSDIKIAAVKETYRKFNELDRHHTAEHTPGWRWCLSTTCRQGQVHEASVKPAKGSSSKSRKPNDDLICKCFKCGAEACVVCDRPWHEGETCRQYQARVKGRLEEEDKAIKQINKLARKCPSCGTMIEKNGGCPHMTCKCGVQFCWNCMSAFSRGYCLCTQHQMPLINRVG